MKTPPEPGRVERLLVILSAGIGDFIIAVPALKALRRLYPRARMTLAISSRTLEYARGFGAEETVAMDNSGLLPPSRWAACFNAALGLRRGRFDLAVNLYQISSAAGMLKMAALFLAVAPSASAGRDTDGRGFFYGIKLPDSSADGVCQGEHYARLVARLGGRAEPREKADLWISAPARRAADDFLARNGLAPGRFIGINPGGAQLSHRWTADGFAAVAQMLKLRAGMPALITGGPGEETLAAEIAAKIPGGAAVSAGKFGFDGTLALVKSMRLLVTTHSSLMHAANAFETPFVALAGISDIRRDGPYAPAAGRFEFIQHAGFPCGDENRPSPAMLAIRPEEVFAAAERLL
ncbi:MAG: glycosyltransferase family 9 protein [Elusimicrobiales bacterium]